MVHQTTATRDPGFRRSAIAVLAILALFAGTARAQSIFAEENFSESQHSALLQTLSLEETEHGDFFTGFRLYLASVRVLDVYYGDLKKSDEIDVQINVWLIGLDAQVERMSAGPFILSFCSSPEGVYYTNTNFVILPADDAHVAEFERLRKQGTDFDGKHDCGSSNFDLGPIVIDPEADQGS